ncbi:MAG: M3 family oligoendopeptidase [Alphaproteobacteria bacterium]|nr:M3 family oligoendopeptidase [Alphaproteobacteria bacterium]
MSAETAETLPQWNVADLIDPNFGNSRSKAEFWQPDFALLKAKIADLTARYRGRLGTADGDEIAVAISDYQIISEDIGRISSYAKLLHVEDMEDPKRGAHYQHLLEELTSMSQDLVFFTLELNALDPEAVQRQISDSAALEEFASWLRDLRAGKPYELPEREEQLLSQKSLTGRVAWVRLFDEITAAMRFPMRGNVYTQSQILKFFSDPDRTVRQDAAEALTTELGKHQHVLVSVTNVLAKDKAIEDDWRGFARPISSRNLSNLIEDEVVNALRNAVKAAYPKLSHRYYVLKARLLGFDRLQHWDRLAPLPQETETTVSWSDARKLVLDAYQNFSPKIGAIAERFFREGWIDAAPKPGKAGGAFAHPTVPSAHPYILLNYQGKGRDVMTLAHELGHGVHQVLAAQQGYLKSQTPLTLAETASVFGEMLSFESLLSRCNSNQEKIALLAHKTEDMLNTVVRQISFLDYEIQVHDARRNAELSPEQLSEIWCSVATESLGPVFDFSEDFGTLWGYVPHFIHSPFYVYAYAFGDCLVNALYQVYQDSNADFVARYIDLLSAGGSKRYDELLEPFGLNARDSAFWNKGLSVIEDMIDDLENLVD